MDPLTPQQLFDQAVRHHQAGRLLEAEELYRQLLAQQPRHPGALHYLGVVSNQLGKKEIAVDLIRSAIAISPTYAEAHYNLGVALTGSAKIDEAIAAYRQSIALKPNFPEPHSNLGNALRDKKQLDEAIAEFRQAIALNPNFAEAHSNLGNALRDKGHFDDAIAAYRRAIALKPNYAEAHNNLGNALQDKGLLDDAIAAYQQAISLKPAYADAHSNLGNTLKLNSQLDEAITAFRQAIALNPNLPEAHSNLGNALQYKGQLNEAIAEFRQTVAMRPDLPQAHSNLSSALKDRGQLDEAIAAYRQAVALRPDYADARSNLVLSLHYHPDYDAQTIAEELRLWNRQHAEPLRKFIQPHSNDRNPDRPLRIGYVSPDFQDHPVGRNLLPWLHLHDRNQFQITCYAHVFHPDALTRHFQKNADNWRNIVGLSDEQVANQIREDKIDILIDLALHTAGNRLLVFAYKPAPVQASYLGYCGSTGLTTMDYRISDPYLDPPDAGESYYTEKTIHLPRTYWCYQPGVDQSLAPSPPPALKNGFITFGCQNNYCKISSATWKTWIDILRAQPTSKLLVYAGQGSHRDTAKKNLADAGIDPDRLQFSDSRRAEYFQRYNDIDIALDPFPFGGGTTTCDALWMGVPVVTLSGKTAVGRGGRSILSNLGLTDLIAYSPDEYVQIALNLASDPDRMNSLRRAMRPRLQASPLMNAQQFARDIESVYRQMWHTWARQ